MINNLVQMSLDDYLLETKSNILEDVPWRSGKITLDTGILDKDGLTYECFILSGLNWLFQLKPSFMFVIPSLKKLNKIGNSSNGNIIYAKHAQELGYTIVNSGTCTILTKWFGDSKENRTLDTFQRIFETGFTLTDFNGFNKKNSLVKLDKDSEISISSSDYSHPGVFLGNIYSTDKDGNIVINDKNIKVTARITRVK